MANLKRDIEFLFELGSMRNIQRAWRQQIGMDVANDLDHTMRVIWLALILARMEGAGSEEKIIKMAMVHDLAESRTGDHHYVQKVYVEEKDDLAAKEILDQTSLEDFYSDVLQEYEARASIEAKLVKDADNLDVDIEMKELVERGSKLPEKWRGNREKVRNEKLYTESAKKLWDELQNSDPASWHLASNKWHRIPEAGK